ncbi:hypothetical protein BGZ50_007519, partial [Haplosporangium sp. Z 11]
MSKASGSHSRRRHYKFRKPLTFATDIETAVEEWFTNNMDQDEEEATTHETYSQPEELTDEALWNLLMSRKNTDEGSEFRNIVRFHIKKQLSKPLWQQFSDSRKDPESVRLGLQDHIQTMRYQEKQPLRIVDYIHRYDWMHPRAPLRQKNDLVHQKISKDLYINRAIIDQADAVDYSLCEDCVKKDDTDIKSRPQSTDRPDSWLCRRCTKWIGGVEKQMNERKKKAQKEIQNILKLVNQDYVESKKPVMGQSRCQWCGVKIPPFSLK